MEDRGIRVRFPAQARGFTLSPKSTDRLWGPSKLIFNGARNTVTRSQAAAATQLRLEPKLKMSEAVSPLPHTPSWNM